MYVVTRYPLDMCSFLLILSLVLQNSRSTEPTKNLKLTCLFFHLVGHISGGQAISWFRDQIPRCFPRQEWYTLSYRELYFIILVGIWSLLHFNHLSGLKELETMPS